MVSQEIPLSEALEQFADSVLWAEFTANFASIHEARAALHRAAEDQGVIAYYRDRAAETDGEAHKESAQLRLAKSLIQNFNERVQTGELRVTCLQPPLLGRSRIPVDLWAKLHLNFRDSSAEGGGYTLTDIRVSISPEAVVRDLPKRCATWLAHRRAERGDEAKSTLLHDALREFGDALPTRVFNQAYGEVYGRQRGRPRLAARK
jgi:hypothetical protein